MTHSPVPLLPKTILTIISKSRTIFGERTIIPGCTESNYLVIDDLAYNGMKDKG